MLVALRLSAAAFTSSHIPLPSLGVRLEYFRCRIFFPILVSAKDDLASVIDDLPQLGSGWIPPVAIHQVRTNDHLPEIEAAVLLVGIILLGSRYCERMRHIRRMERRG